MPEKSKSSTRTAKFNIMAKNQKQVLAGKVNKQLLGSIIGNDTLNKS